MAIGQVPQNDGLSNLFNSTAQGVNESNQVAADLKMRSAIMQQQLEGQRQNALSELQAQANAEKERYARESPISQDATDAFAKALGLPSGLQFKSSDEPMLDKLMQMKLYGMTPQSHMIANPDGSMSLLFTNRLGQVLGQTGAGLSKKAQEDIINSRTAYENFKQFADDTSNRLALFATAQGGAGGLAQGMKLTLNQLSQSDPNAKAFIDQLPFDAGTLDKRVLGSIRVGGQKLMDSTQDAIFSKNDTVETALAKMNHFRDLGTQQVKGAYDATGLSPEHGIPYPQDIPELQPGYVHPQSLMLNVARSGASNDRSKDFLAWQAARNAKPTK